MGDGDIFVRDPASLEELNNTMEYVADSMLKIEESVDSYLEGVKAVVEQQRDAIKEKLEEAEERLSEAEEDLSSCEASQTEDEDGNITPSCNYERQAVREAREEVEEWRKKFEAACNIVDEVNHEIEEYRAPGSFLYPPGGKYFTQYLAGEFTDKATESLRICLDHIQEYQEARASDGKVSANEIIENPNKSEDDIPLSDSEKEVRRENLVEKVVDEQAKKSENIADANRVMKCPTCGRAKALCICGNIRKDMKMINN